MRALHLYLLAYFLLVSGAFLTLWQSDTLHRIPLGWLTLGALTAIVLGVLLAVTSPPVRGS